MQTNTELDLDAIEAKIDRRFLGPQDYDMLALLAALRAERAESGEMLVKAGQ